eukprot:CAMPEP_0118945846 /NCGR_PEP_ID=MMETSP1169-20130426/43090_1 /TAXON_ID=36882 /ORGANISM="Pyramimonas obovata, Strain CCMP722" /LENGTH=58 /DNA_ID=CAMNT_0006891657 /DNA_START=83 /DNA_END=259 /DNA_ORIENTATION=+
MPGRQARLFPVLLFCHDAGVALLLHGCNNGAWPYGAKFLDNHFKSTVVGGPMTTSTVA